MTIHETAATGYAKVGDTYERGRPGYPPAAVDFLRKTLGLAPGRRVVDVGAGTGKFTREIVDSGAEVLAIEPVADMRRKFAELLPRVDVRDGSAEALPLPIDSVDVVLVAQAFHWFRGKEALAEFARVLKPGGQLALVWNIRDETHDWVAKLGAIINAHEGSNPRYAHGAWREAFRGDAHFGPPAERVFSFAHAGPPAMVTDRALSTSFIAALPPAEKARVREAVERLLAEHPETRGRAEIAFPYRTEVFVYPKR